MMIRSLIFLKRNSNGLRSIRYESTKAGTTISKIESKFQGEEQEIQVKEISRETIKPSSPTPSHLRKYTLSIHEQTHHHNHVPVLLFYPPSSSSPHQTPPKVDVTSIKRSLAETLSRFYPLAGRLKDLSTVSCTDQGIPLIQTHVSCRLSDVVDSPPQKLLRLTKFLLPPRDLISEQRPISEMLSLVFQINVFDCGGVVIGCYMLHKLLDGSSLGTFLTYWAADSTNRYDDLVDPDFSTGPKLFPPCSDIESLFAPAAAADLQVSPAEDDNSNSVDDNGHQSGPVVDTVVVAKSFVFSKAAITQLKTNAASGNLNPSSFEAVAALVWEHAAAAAAPAIGGRATSLLFTASIRGEIGKGTMGNLVAPVEAKSKNWGGGLVKLAAEISSTRSTVKDKAKEFQGPKGTEAFLAYLKALMPRLMGYQPGSYTLSSCCRLGWEDTDFGFGKPSRFMFIPIDDDGKVVPQLRNFITFTTHVDPNGNGIEAWLILEQKEMEILESNPHFLAFASPN